MLEIVALYFLCKLMGEKLRAKGWEKPLWMQVAVVLAWLGGAFLGSVACATYVALTRGEAAVEKMGIELYFVALLSGLLSVGLLFLIATMLPRKEPTDPFHQERSTR